MEDECPICLIDMKDEIKTILKCKHIFHYECFVKMLEKYKTCPLCREQIKLKNNNKHLIDEEAGIIYKLFENIVKIWFFILIIINIYVFGFLMYELFMFFYS